ncbi:MAG: hypothetical protein EOM20_05795 [Spartobacteria bacterium]|nr:hypothetical protein [Spartobacteria bacterium]
MMISMKRLLVVFIVVLSGSLAARAELSGGRAFANDRSFTLEGSVGTLRFDKGTIEETKRAYDNSGNNEDYKAYLSKYTLEELGFDGSYPTFGLFVEKQWKFLSLQLDAEYSHPTASATADMHPTASGVPDRQKGYYIGVNKVTYQGKDYEYMFIPNGQDFDADIQSGIVELKALITPCHLTGGDTLAITPWVYLGLMGVWGSYEIDAGPARGLVQYEVPPETYVVGGKGSGDAGGAIPEIGFGGEVRVSLGPMRGGNAQLVFLGEVGFFKFKGSTDTLGFDSRREKDLDLDYMNMELRLMLELPLWEHCDFVIGASLEKVTATADLDSANRSVEDQEELSEKYDKHIELETTQLRVMAGFRF